MKTDTHKKVHNLFIKEFYDKKSIKKFSRRLIISRISQEKKHDKYVLTDFLFQRCFTIQKEYFDVK